MLLFCLVKLLIEKSLANDTLIITSEPYFSLWVIKLLSNAMLIYFNSYWLKIKPVQFFV